MDFTTYLDCEWTPALGCTEPASVAFGAACAAEQVEGDVRAVHLVCDRRIYKNSYAAGIPHSGGKTGIDWALVSGALLPDASAGLEGFRRIDDALLAAGEELIRARAVTVEVVPEREGLLVDCRVTRTGGVGRAVIEEHHAQLVRVERDGREVERPLEADVPLRNGEIDPWLRGLSFADCLDLARALLPAERERLRRGADLNLALAQHGIGLLPEAFVEGSRGHLLGHIASLACGGVLARMSGEDLPAMTLAGSGNKGITVAVPLRVWSEAKGVDAERADEALALACLLTSATTLRLGTLSSMCGCANAAGIGLASGFVFLLGGGEEELSRAVNNMVANVPGVICDGAKMGCGLKATTAVDSAWRAATLAVSGFGIPHGDGIVGAGGAASLENLERIARRGMRSMDEEILRIMQEKRD